MKDIGEKGAVEAPAYQMPDSDQQDINGGLISGTIGLRSEPSQRDTHEIPVLPREEYIAPYRVTMSIASSNSPFYESEDSRESYGIGLEDKLLGQRYTQNANNAPFDVAKYFADEGLKMLNSITLLHGKDGENRAARARALLSSPEILNLIKVNSPHGNEDASIFAELETAFAGFIRKLNAGVLQPADDYRQAVYRDLGLIDAQGSMRTHGLSSRIEGEEVVHSPSEFNKVRVRDAVEKLSPMQQRGWFFMRNLTQNLSNPDVRDTADHLSKVSRY